MHQTANRLSAGEPLALKEMSPSSFGLVMATGIVALAASMMGHPRLGTALFLWNVAQYAALWVLYVLRAWRYPGRVLGDVVSHRLGPGYFTVVAATGVLSSQFVLQAQLPRVGLVLWALAIVLWIGLTYAIFAAFTVKPVKPTLDKGINGGWLLSVVATQSVVVCSVLLVPYIQPSHRPALIFAALSMWLWGGMQYVWTMSLIFYRYTFFPLSPADLEPPYWINMGAMAISTLAGSLLIENAADVPFLATMLPFLEGFTLFYWAAGTWWIPMLLLLGAWRYLWNRFPLRYDPLYWGAVFPVGMYAACTWQLGHAMEFGFLSAVALAFLYAGLAAWSVVFCAMATTLSARYLGQRKG